HALLGGTEKVNSEQPLMNGDMRALHDGAGAASELVAASIALEITGLRLASHPGHLNRSAVRAERGIRPTGFLQMGDCGFFVGEFGGVNVGHGYLLGPFIANPAC